MDILSNVAFYTYMLRLSNGPLYVGSTDDLGRRFAEHQAGSGCRTTALFRPVEPVYSELHPDRLSAIKGERQLKGWSRGKKHGLINGNSVELKRLARCHSKSFHSQ
jgi:predicted GIY-YIG superfamily endonuclease